MSGFKEAGHQRFRVNVLIKSFLFCMVAGVVFYRFSFWAALGVLYALGFSAAAVAGFLYRSPNYTMNKEGDD